MARICIICEKESASGRKVADDLVISFLRWVKKTTNTAKNNELVVCPNCIEVHSKKRAAFERNIVIYIVFAGIIFVVVALLPLFSGKFSLGAFAIGIVMAAIIAILPILTSYSPKLAGESGGQIAKVDENATNAKESAGKGKKKVKAKR
ncbi:MAG: hypothetical protein NT051_05245 [Candidatus Micrarchaeota archaeon]|nr:hypothetical protein [Candidatus Micrarchaeota archaeon]